MNKLDQIIETARKLPQQRQDEIAEVVESMVAPETTFTAEERNKIERGLAQADAGELIPLDQSFFAKYRNA